MIVPQISGGGSSCNVWSFTLSPSPIQLPNSGGDVCQSSDIIPFGDNADPGWMVVNTYSWTGQIHLQVLFRYPSIHNPGSSYSGTYASYCNQSIMAVQQVQTSLNVNQTQT